MKNKKLLIIPTLLLGINCIGCDEEEPAGEAPHVHTYDQQKTEDKYLASNATCTEQAKYFYSCSCGEKGTETFNSGEATGHSKSTSVTNDGDNHWYTCTNPGCNQTFDKTHHSYGELVVDEAATCTAAGTGHRNCTEPSCGASITETIPMEDHDKSNTWSNDATQHWHSCSGCDEKFNISTHVPGEQWLKDGTGHWKTCSVCGNGSLEKAEHTFGELIVDDAPLCNMQGNGHRVCSVCGYEKTEYIPIDPDAHNYKYEKHVNATCLATGYTIEKCSFCGSEITIADDPAELGNHDFDVEYVKYANNTQCGLKRYKCLTCGYTYEEVIPHTGNCNFGNYEISYLDDEYCGTRCTIEGCTKANKSAHILNPIIDTDSDGVNPGTRHYVCQRCGWVKPGSEEFTSKAISEISITLGLPKNGQSVDKNFKYQLNTESVLQEFVLHSSSLQGIGVKYNDSDINNKNTSSLPIVQTGKIVHYWFYFAPDDDCYFKCDEKGKSLVPLIVNGVEVTSSGSHTKSYSTELKRNVYLYSFDYVVEHTGSHTYSTTKFVSCGEEGHARPCTISGCNAYASTVYNHRYAEVITREPNGDNLGSKCLKCIDCGYVQEGSTEEFSGTRAGNVNVNINLPVRGELLYSGFTFEGEGIQYSKIATCVWGVDPVNGLSTDIDNPSDYILTADDEGTKFYFSFQINAEDGYYIPTDENGKPQITFTINDDIVLEGPTSYTRGNYYSDIGHAYNYRYTYTVPHVHDMADEHVDPTCNTYGYTRRYCTLCDFEENIPDSTQTYGEHNYVLTDSVEPTYSSLGSNTYVCEHCGDTYTEPVPHLGGHSYDTTKLVSVGDNGCAYVCTIDGCNGYYNRTPHNYVEIIDSEPDGDNPGHKHSECYYCGHVKPESSVDFNGTKISSINLQMDLPQVGDTFNNSFLIETEGVSKGSINARVTYEDADGNTQFPSQNDLDNYVISEDDIGKIFNLAFKLKNMNGYYFPTDETGMPLITVTLNNKVEVSLPLAPIDKDNTYFVFRLDYKIPEPNQEHTIFEKYYEPTCTSYGYTVRTCLDDSCDFQEIVYDDPQVYLEHDYERELVRPSTDSQCGIERYTCKVCGHIEENYLMHQGDHQCNNTSTYFDEVYHGYFCTIDGCDYKDKYSHAYADVVDTAPTATTPGLKHKECRYCHHILDDSYEEFNATKISEININMNLPTVGDTIDFNYELLTENLKTLYLNGNRNGLRIYLGNGEIYPTSGYVITENDIGKTIKLYFYILPEEPDYFFEIDEAGTPIVDCYINGIKITSPDSSGMKMNGYWCFTYEYVVSDTNN